MPITTGTTAFAGLSGAGSSGIRLHVKVKSLWDMRWEHVIRQRQEHSCAAAATATLLTHFFGFPTTEEEMLQSLQVEAMRDQGGADFDPTQLGYNLRHIRAVASKGGLAAVAFKVDLRNIERVKIPVITRVTIRGWDHFAVFRGARAGRVYLADPAFGNTSYRLDEFERVWSGIMMGFVRRGVKPPSDYDLLLDEVDKLGLDSSEISRRTQFRAFGVGDQRAFYSDVSLAPQLPVEGLSDGLDSVFPSQIENFREFGTDFSF
jgi:predicted double-glycine peptidase